MSRLWPAWITRRRVKSSCREVTTKRFEFTKRRSRTRAKFITRSDSSTSRRWDGAWTTNTSSVDPTRWTSAYGRRTHRRSSDRWVSNPQKFNFWDFTKKFFAYSSNHARKKLSGTTKLSSRSSARIHKSRESPGIVKCRTTFTSSRICWKQQSRKKSERKRIVDSTRSLDRFHMFQLRRKSWSERINKKFNHKNVLI